MKKITCFYKLQIIPTGRMLLFWHQSFSTIFNPFSNPCKIIRKYFSKTINQWEKIEVTF